MSVEAPYVMTYTVAAEAWYADVMPERREIMIGKSHPDGGVDWEFAIRQVSNIGVRAEIFDESWPAFVEIPELFVALANLGRGATLDDVRGVLDRLGYDDATQRTSPYGDRPGAPPLRPAVEAVVGRMSDETWRKLEDTFRAALDAPEADIDPEGTSRG